MGAEATPLRYGHTRAFLLLAIAGEVWAQQRSNSSAVVVDKVPATIASRVIA